MKKIDNWITQFRSKNKLNKDIELLNSDEILNEYSTDASIFKVIPNAVIFPKNKEEIKSVIQFISKNKKKFPQLSITGRAGGTDMTGGSINEGIILSFTKYMNKIKSINKIKSKERNKHKQNSEKYSAVVEPGVYYRDFEKQADHKDLLFPSYPASKSLCAFGGMIANNCAGEKTLQYGKTNKYVRRLKVILADGNEYEFKKLNIDDLNKKLRQKNFEGDIYRKVHRLLEDNHEIIEKARPIVSKNSAGYALWDVYKKDHNTGKEIFDLTQLFVGSQGSLGIWTEAEIELVKKKKYSQLIACHIKNVNTLSEFVNIVLPFNPESLETFGKKTLFLGLHFLPEIAKKIGVPTLKLAWQFKDEALLTLLHGIPKFIVLVLLTDENKKMLNNRIEKLHLELKNNKVPHLVLTTEEEAEKYWIMRRESFNLLRKKVKDKKATPFIDDFIVKPEFLPEFMPKLEKILFDHDVHPTFAGHAGSGNFHIIPLMDLKKESEREKIPVVCREVHDLVVKYHGSITAEHNDGLIRTPYLEQMYGKEIIALFEEVKKIFDPLNMFNPGKKVHGNLEYAMKHINPER